MLWYKAWLETRSRFLISLFGILVISANWVVHEDGIASPIQPTSWYYFVLHKAHTTLSVVWVLAVSLLMMGGLVRETAVGASDFTLALPVSRARLMWARIGMGFLQAATLAVIPWVVIFLLACATGKANSIENAAFHLLLLAGGGSVFAAWALLVSTLIAGEYTAPAVCLGAVLAVAIAMGEKPLSEWSPASFLTGEQYLNPNTMMLAGPVPWLRLIVTIMVAIVLTGAAIKTVQAREF
jgi:ABC-type transport system involved in multi-copper enzyme maturation permease subunit